MRRFGYLFLLLAAISLFNAGCAKTQDASAAANSAAPAAADGNLAPVSNPAQSDASSGYQDVADNQAQAVYAQAPPPPLPDYSQPPCPGDNNIWTPGYWSYGDAGYYWVPGAWVLAPYVDALWTPPYWDFFDGRYRWHSGYWGDHIGYYGGINYGFGYTGQGYYGGYWKGGAFAYNRSVTNVDANVHNIYERSVPNGRSSNRVSYNGGPGGINARPIPAELAAQRERHTPAVAAQIEHARSAASNREQLASVNRGRPSTIAQAKPLPTSYRTPAERPAAAEPPSVVAQNAPGRPEASQAHNQRQEPRPVQQPAARQVAPAARPQPVQERAAPQRPAEQARPQPAARPEPAPRSTPAPRAEPAPRSARPTPAARPAEAHPEEKEERK